MSPGLDLESSRRHVPGCVCDGVSRKMSWRGKVTTSGHSAGCGSTLNLKGGEEEENVLNGSVHLWFLSAHSWTLRSDYTLPQPHLFRHDELWAERKPAFLQSLLIKCLVTAREKYNTFLMPIFLSVFQVRITHLSGVASLDLGLSHLALQQPPVRSCLSLSLLPIQGLGHLFSFHHL